jgi:hypothetical protein
VNEQCLLTIIAAPAVEETLVDWLLEREELSGFSSLPIDGHGSRASDMSLAEQVAGRQRKIMFYVHSECDRVRSVIDDLKHDFSGAGLHYWVMPLTEAARID